jgi:hypothetical protein
VIARSAKKFLPRIAFLCYTGHRAVEIGSEKENDRALA